jgi:hypothetical protein
LVRLFRLRFLLPMLIVVAGGAAWGVSSGLAGLASEGVPSVLVVTPFLSHSSAEPSEPGEGVGRADNGVEGALTSAPSSEFGHSGERSQVSSAEGATPSTTPKVGSTSTVAVAEQDESEVVNPEVVVVQTPTISAPPRRSQATTKSNDDTSWSSDALGTPSS